MIKFFFHPSPIPAKVALFLEEAGLPYGGISAVAAPDGRSLAQAGAAATVLIVDIDPLQVGPTPKRCLIDRRPQTYGALVARIDASASARDPLPIGNRATGH